METALTLMDGGQPVFPLEIVKTMRDQRAMMVQTTVQRNRAGLPVCQMILLLSASLNSFIALQYDHPKLSSISVLCLM